MYVDVRVADVEKWRRTTGKQGRANPARSSTAPSNRCNGKARLTYVPQPRARRPHLEQALLCEQGGRLARPINGPRGRRRRSFSRATPHSRLNADITCMASPAARCSCRQRSRSSAWWEASRRRTFRSYHHSSAGDADGRQEAHHAAHRVCQVAPPCKAAGVRVVTGRRSAKRSARIRTDQAAPQATHEPRLRFALLLTG